MKFIKLITTVLIILLSSINRVTALTIKEYKEMSNEEIVKIYVKGVGEGLMWGNTMINVRQNTNIFCPPPKMALNGENYISILQKELESNSSYKDSDPIELVLVLALEKVFPCK